MKNPFGVVVPEGRTTFHASPERLSDSVLQGIVRETTDSPIMRTVLNSLGGLVVVLDDHRQILAASKEVTDALNVKSDACVVGLRPGEMLNCIHFTEGPGGCGTSKHCRVCGAVSAILECIESRKTVQSECLLSTERDGKRTAAEYRVYASPLRIGVHDLTVLTLNDISADKRRDLLASKFYNDLTTTMTTIHGWSELLSSDDPKGVAGQIVALSAQLTAEMTEQHILMQAEEGTLEVERSMTHASSILEGLDGTFSTSDLAKGKHLVCEPAPDDALLDTDVRLLELVLNHMVRNALEATSDDETVEVWFEWREGHPGFVVHNPGVIKEDVALKIFNRAFSTKASAGRGIGTYIMKSVGEDYLDGSVDFMSTQEEGTRFWIYLPGTRRPGTSETETLSDARLRTMATAMPSTLRQRIVTAAIQADADTVLELLGEVGEQDKGLVESFSSLAKEFQYEKLVELLKE